MPRAVRFELRPPLASWSETGAAVRPTDLVPSWSAVVGLVGAALGWEREDPRLARLAADYGLAVEVRSSGERLVDYHTIQSATARLAEQARVRTRLQELTVGEPNTTLTHREYVQGGHYVVVLLPATGKPVANAEEIAAALLRPAFPLYAGRRSCLIGCVPAEVVEGSLDEVLPGATHWDARLKTALKASAIRERRDMPIGPRKYVARQECIR